MEKAEKKSRTLKISIIVSVLLSIIIILVILKLTLDPTTVNQLLHANIRYEYFLLAVFLNVLTWFIWGTRLMVLSNATDKNVQIGLWGSTKIVIANLFLASISPSMAGGEPVRIYLLKEDGMSLGGATASVLGERLIDAIFVLICIPFALFIFKDRIDNKILNTGLLIGVAVFILFVAIFLYAIKYPDKVKSFLTSLELKIAKLFKRKEHTKLTDFINREVDNFHNSMVFFVRDGKKAFCIGGVLTVAYWFTGFLIPSALLVGLGLPPYIIESFAAQILLLVIIMMPTTPGSSGVTEVGMAGLYSVILGSQNLYLLGVFVVLFRFITYHIGLIAGAIFQYRIFKSLTSFSLDTLTKQK
ncbi:MAG: flippase-like domain-containing protein [Candidatus Thermoplasmatota archaeon]|nr:flippase-like domain-containing protein [Candidatus Thermoplasmatota archaeon]